MGQSWVLHTGKICEQCPVPWPCGGRAITHACAPCCHARAHGTSTNVLFILSATTTAGSPPVTSAAGILSWPSTVHSLSRAANTSFLLAVSSAFCLSTSSLSSYIFFASALSWTSLQDMGTWIRKRPSQAYLRVIKPTLKNKTKESNSAEIPVYVEDI